MNRSNKSKIAVTLLSALTFGANDASAMNSGIKTSGNLATKSSSFSTSKDSKLGSKNERIEKGVSVLKKDLWKKTLAGFVITAGAVEATNETAAGITLAMGKKPDSIFKGKYSITNLIHSKIKKDEDENPEDKNKEGPVEQGNKEKEKEKEKEGPVEQGNKEKEKEKENENENENEKTARGQILEKFRKAWNNDNTWEDFKIKFSKMMDYVCNHGNIFDDCEINKEALQFFISVCKGEAGNFFILKVMDKNSFAVQNNRKVKFKIELTQVNNNQKECTWKVSSNKVSKLFVVPFD